MAITLEKDRLEFPNYFKWYDSELDTLWNVPPTLINGFELINAPNDVLSVLNYFNASSKFYINGILEHIPDELEEHFKLIERMVTHWAVTGEYCLVIQNGVLNTIRPDYVFPKRRPDNRDIITGYYFVFPLPDNAQRARVIEYDILTGKAFQNERDFFSNQLEEKSGGTAVDIQLVIWEQAGGYYKEIKGLVRELNVRFALLQLALNSTAIPLIQIATEGMGGGLLSADGITPARIAGLGKSGIGLVVPPPFTGEEGGRYIERAGTGLEEALAYIRMILGSLAVMSGVPEYVYGVSLSQSTAEVERIMFMGQSRINRIQRALTNTFKQLGIDVEFPTVMIGSERVTERIETNATPS